MARLVFAFAFAFALAVASLVAAHAAPMPEDGAEGPDSTRYALVFYQNTACGYNQPWFNVTAPLGWTRLAALTQAPVFPLTVQTTVATSNGGSVVMAQVLNSPYNNFYASDFVAMAYSAPSFSLYWSPAGMPVNGLSYKDASVFNFAAQLTICTPLPSGVVVTSAAGRFVAFAIHQI
eukprot:a1618_272.p2 GENE.a1618_272~~a1618_272.p2  ORF type:complete len:187 (+),score=74.90 a1618_272:31-561(+)